MQTAFTVVKNCFLKLNQPLRFFFLFLFFGFTRVINAQPYLSNFTGQVFKSGFNEVEGVCFDKSGQGYAWEKGGKVWVIDTNGIKITTPLIDISEEVGNWRDHGLNGFALDPDFLTNGYFYLYYTVDRHYLMNFGTANYNSAVNEYYNATIARVTRYTANSATNFTTLISNSRLILIGENKKTGIPVLHESHSGGTLLFGTDGSLLISTGDGASYAFVDSGGGATYWSQALIDTIIKPKENVGSFRSQIIDSHNGKILRVDPATGDGLPTNPYYDSLSPRSAQSRVWDLGLRNPFRMTLRPGTGVPDITAGDPGVLYIGDVGWDSWEDMNVSTGPGLNFGWPNFEGLTPTVGYANVVNVFNNDAPNPLYGGSCVKPYFKFSDLLKQASLAPSFPNPCDALQQIPNSIPHWLHTRPVIDWSHSQALARTGIYNGNNAAEISIGNNLSPVKGFDFVGSASVGGAWYEGTKYPYQYQNTYFHADYAQSWILNCKFNSANTADSIKYFASNLGPVVNLTYNPKDEWLYFIKYPADIYRIVYTVSVNNPPVAVASMDTTYGYKPLTVHFTGNASSDPENLPLNYSWNFGDGSPISNASNPLHVFNPTTNNQIAYSVILTVTDNIGQSDSTLLTVYVNDTPPQVSITSFADSALYTMSHATILPLQATVSDFESTDHFLNYSWQTFLHHNIHEHPEATDTNRITTTEISPIGCGANVYYYRIVLTVTDSIGLSTTVQKILLPSCNPPSPNFTADITTGCQSQIVNFSDATTNFPDSWLWTFAGGTPATSTLQNPIVTYNSAGTFNVTLSSTNSRGFNSVTKTGFIKINSRPPATITPSAVDSVCSLTPVLLTANTGTNYVYQWRKNGVDIAGATAITYNAIASGSYTVKVTRTTTGCNKTSVAKKIVYRTVSATITANGPTTFCTGDSVLLSVPAGAASYQWFKGNIAIAGATNNYLMAKSGGNYKVTVTDFYGCSKTSGIVKVTISCRENIIDNLETDAEQINESIFPNPANNLVTLRLNFAYNTLLDVSVYDALGRQVLIIAENKKIEAGYNESIFDVSILSGGVYFLKIADAKHTTTRKLIIEK